MLLVESSTEQMAAVLHDLVEDTPHTLEDLRREEFPRR
jgi:(p)ppGpp synthase/HD superfamily hydrolase